MVNLSNLIDFESLNKRALIQYPSLLKAWLPGGAVKGTEYTCADICGGKGNSFSVNITNGKWSELTEEPPFTEGEFTCLGECVVLDVDTKDVYKKYLNPIGKYKAPELIEIAKSMNIPIETDGKKKVKKTLYDDINIYQLNLFVYFNTLCPLLKTILSLSMPFLDFETSLEVVA